MAEANKEKNVKLERMNQKQLIQAYEPVITELLNSTMMLPQMACIFDDEDRQEIVCVNERNGKIKAATLFINKLVKSDNPGWYAKFIDALKDKSYSYLAKCLESQDTEMQQSVFRRVMRKCFKYMTLIDPRPLLPELLAKECITTEEQYEIMTAADNIPIRNVNFILLDAVVSHREEWFDIFLEVLKNGGYGSVAEKIEEGLAEEFMDEEGETVLKRVIVHEVSSVCEDDEVPVYEEPVTQPTTEHIMEEAEAQVPPGEDMPGQLRLRPYQVQQAELAKQGNNVIIIAPTGSGKTYVAMGIVQNHFELVECEEKPKVLFIVPTVPLVTQQYKLFKANFKKEVNKLSGDDTRLSVITDDTFHRSDILVLTPQILTNALASGKIKSIKLFTMIILDECHHTSKDHPYATMMKCYLQEKQKSSTGLPQIVGLTASVGLDNSNTKEKALDHILRLLAHLDVQKISMSDDRPDNANTVTEEAEETSDRSHDPFKDKVIETMIKIEKRMLSTPGFGSVSPPQDRVSQTYGNNWLASLQIDKISDASIRGILVACTKHLKVYYSALVLGSWCMAIDALENISKELTTICAAPKTDLDHWLLKLFEDMEPILRSHCENDKNPKLESMKTKILVHTEEINAPPRVIVFCMTRELTRAVCRWISRDPDLALFNPDVIVGVNKAVVASDDRAGMTQTEQNEVLKKFDQGDCKILVATSVAQEGIDIRECDYVINYGYLTSDVGRVQSRGRVRAEVGKFTAIGAEGGGTVRREENNKRRESLMNEMLEEIKDMPDEMFKSKMARHQKELLTGWRRLENMQKVQREIPNDIKRQFRLECFECGKFACTFADIRTIKGMYHVVIAKNFKQNIFTALHQGEMYDLDIETTHKLYCGTCEEKCDWGIQILYKKMSFSVIKIKSFLVRDPKGQTKKYAKWARFHLKAAEITDEEMDEYMEEN